MEISAKYLEGNGGFALLVIPHSLVDGGAGAGAGAMAMAILWTAAMFLEPDLDGGEDGDWGGRLVSPITMSRGCALSPKRDRVLSLLESAGGAVSWCAKFVASRFYSAGRSGCSSAVVAMINLPARSFLVVLYCSVVCGVVSCSVV
jgi:hypothetical protein